MSLWYILTLCVVAATICYVFWNYNKIKKMPEGTPEMRRWRASSGAARTPL